MVGVEQAPRLVALGVSFDKGGQGCRGRLEFLAHPVGLQQHLGGGGDQRPSGLDRRFHLGPESGLPGSSQPKQVGAGLLQKLGLDVPQQSACSTARKVSIPARTLGSNWRWPRLWSCATLLAAAT